MAIQGFQSLKGAIESLYGSIKYSTDKFFATLSLNDFGAALDVAPRYLQSLGTGSLDNPQSSSVNKKRILKITAHGLLAGYVIKFTSGNNIYREIQIAKVLDADYVLLGGELLNDAGNGDTFEYFKLSSPIVDNSGRLITLAGALEVVDRLDSEYIDTNADLIPQSSAAPLTVVANLAADVRKIRSQDTVGKFINVYAITAGPTYTLITTLGPGGSEKEVNIASGSVIGIRHMLDSDINAANPDEELFVMEFFG